MKYKQFIGIFFLVLLTFAYAWYEAGRPKEVDWSRTYSREDKIPYGTYILYRSLPFLFPDAKVISVNFSLYEELQRVKDERNAGYISVSAKFGTDGVELRQLLDWIGQGNWAFIAANNIQDTLLKVFNIKLGYSKGAGEFRLLYGGLEHKMYPEDESYVPFFKLPADFAGEILGGDGSDTVPHFIRIPYEKGQLLLNLKPVLFTNHAVLDSVRGDYYYKVLSGLPVGTEKIIWDAYQTKPLMQSPLRVVLKYPALKLALYLALTGVLLYVLFRIKREQRPVPVMLPPRSRMLEFVSTVSLLYYKKKEHVSVAVKRIDFFLDQVRTRYLLHTDHLDNRFIELLAERSGVEKDEIKALVQLIIKVRVEGQVSESELGQLMEETEKFVGTGGSGIFGTGEDMDMKKTL